MNAPEKLQGTAAWFAERTGCLTASRMADAMDTLKSGKESSARRALKIEILAERLTGDVVTHYVTPAMQHGIDTEPAAKAAYSAKTGALITEMGFIRHPSIEYFGASPDGKLDAKTGIEIKCPTTPKHLAWLLAGEVPAEHKPQMLAQCVCAGFESVEFVSYDPRMPKHLQMFVVRFVPTAEERAAVEAAASQFLLEVEEMFQLLTTTEPA
jgi:putative phage-type endonuclease